MPQTFGLGIKLEEKATTVLKYKGSLFWSLMYIYMYIYVQLDIFFFKRKKCTEKKNPEIAQSIFFIISSLQTIYSGDEAHFAVIPWISLFPSRGNRKGEESKNMVLCLITASSAFYLQPGRSRYIHKCMRIQNCGRSFMKHADITRHKIIPSARVDTVGLEVFVVSDLHTEYTENMAWVTGLPKKGKKKEVLLVAGDVAETYEKFVLTMSLLKASFEHVFFVPGNHDLWLRREKDNYIDSLQKLDKLLDACQRLGVETNPSIIDGLAIIPIFSWYHESFDREKDISGIRIPSLELACKDFRACKWSDGLINGDDSLATHFDAMNDKNQDTIQEMLASCNQIISFSHFIPRLELCPEKRMLFYPNLPKMIGSDFLESRIRNIHGARGNTNACHIFGHTHFCWDVLLDGIRYVQAPLAYPRERTRRMNGGEEWLPFCIYSKGELTDNMSPCYWSDYYASNPRTPDVTELAPWVARFYGKL